MSPISHFDQAATAVACSAELAHSQKIDSCSLTSLRRRYIALATLKVLHCSIVVFNDVYRTSVSLSAHRPFFANLTFGCGCLGQHNELRASRD